ncbi:polysaccharide deacetylase family protein [candidate division WOR-3 bacterium]|nr:polysaccharide deacetylase family protein [candidate division WOR-3 bacterium]
MQKKAIQFHRITPDLQFCGTWNTPAQLERFLCFFRDNDMPVVLPEEGPGLIITFDDGERSFYDYAFPILKQYRTRAIVFLIAGYIGKENTWDISLTGRRVPHLTWDQICEMKEWGITFGSHTMTHRNLTRVSDKVLEWELNASKQMITDKIGECRYVSYPFNRVNAQVLRSAREAGYCYGFGGDGTDRMLVKKEAVYITDTRQSLRVKVYEEPPLLYWYERKKQQIINMFTITTMVMKGL